MIQAASQIIAKIIEVVSETTVNFWQNINISQYSAWQVAIDIILVAILFYWLIMLIRGSRATNIIFGLVILALVFAVSQWLKLLALGWILDRLLTVILVAIPIIFQQELRRGLEKLGKTKFFMARRAREMDAIKHAIIDAITEMAENRIGALIVFRNEVKLKEYVETGVMLNARISKELLLSIFSKQSPLHDGAVIIDGERLVAAGCILPHSFKEEYGHKFGTRHKAALGLSEITDAELFVVSEQRGAVSFVSDGRLEENIAEERAEILLSRIFAPKKMFSKHRPTTNS